VRLVYRTISCVLVLYYCTHIKASGGYNIAPLDLLGPVNVRCTKRGQTAIHNQTLSLKLSNSEESGLASFGNSVEIFDCMVILSRVIVSKSARIIFLYYLRVHNNFLVIRD
jgi:hypothetical protein